MLTPDGPIISALIDTGRIDSITSHGELELPDSRFIVIGLPRRIHTYGIGMSLFSLIRNPLAAGGMVDFGVAQP